MQWSSCTRCNILGKYEVSTTKTLFFRILTIWGPGAPHEGPKPVFLVLCFSYIKRNILCKYEVSTTKNKIFEILTIWGPGAPRRGLKPQFFWFDDFLTYKGTYCVNFRSLRPKTKFLKFWPFGARGRPIGALNHDFFGLMIFLHKIKHTV